MAALRIYKAGLQAWRICSGCDDDLGTPLHSNSENASFHLESIFEVKHNYIG